MRFAPVFVKKYLQSVVNSAFWRVDQACEIIERYVVISCKRDEMIHRQLALVALVELVLPTGNL